MKTKQSHCDIVENLLKAALMYETRGEFFKGSRGAYNSAYKKGLLDEVCSHMVLKKGGQGYWDIFENVQEEALMYETRNEFYKGSRGAYNSARRNGWLDEVCSHMVLQKGGQGYWNVFENVQEEALKYKTRGEFSKGSPGAYKSAVKNGWLDMVCSHMILQKGDKSYWDVFENVQEEALKYKTRRAFCKGSFGAYKSARRNGWLDEVCSHIKLKKGGQGYWNIFENVREEALKYKTRLEFSKRSSGAYYSALRNGWLDEVCSHMGKSLNDKPRYIYSFVWEVPNLVYVGLTHDPKQRKRGHLNNESGIVYRTVIEYGEPKFKVVTENPVHVNVAGEHEKKWIQTYTELGYTPVNIAKPGALGGYLKTWTYERCKEEALKYKTRREFQKVSPGAYYSAFRNGWLDEVCSHMVLQKGGQGYWVIFENVREEALKYKTRLEFFKRSPGAYNSARKKGWLDEVCSHMVK